MINTVLIVSPHLDDAALSMASILTAGKATQVIVATCFCGGPAGSYSSVLLDSICGSSEQAHLWNVARQREDREALESVGAIPVHFPLPEALFRVNENGTPTYTAWNQIFNGCPAAGDRPLIDSLINQLTAVIAEWAPCELYSPLGLGGHVDHALCRAAMEQLCENHVHRLLYYEDLPYAAYLSEITAATLPEELKGLRIGEVKEFDWNRKLDLLRKYEVGLSVGTTFERFVEAVKTRAQNLSASNHCYAEAVWCAE